MNFDHPKTKNDKDIDNTLYFKTIFIINLVEPNFV